MTLLNMQSDGGVHLTFSDISVAVTFSSVSVCLIAVFSKVMKHHGCYEFVDIYDFGGQFMQKTRKLQSLITFSCDCIYVQRAMQLIIYRLLQSFIL